MRRFEDYIDVEASLSHCFNTWVASESYPHFVLPNSPNPSENGSVLMRKSTLEWDVAANSTDAQKVIWWHSQEDSVDYSGIVIFRQIHHNKQTRITVTMTWNTLMDGQTSFMRDANMGVVLKNCLEHFKKALLATPLSNPQLKAAV